MVIGTVVLGAVVFTAVWTGIQSGRWQVVHHQGESITIPPSWHRDGGAGAYVETSSRWGLWFLPSFTAKNVPAKARMLPNVGRNLREWQVQNGRQFIYYGVWSLADHTRSIKICVPRTQVNLALAILGSWRSAAVHVK